MPLQAAAAARQAVMLGVPGEGLKKPGGRALRDASGRGARLR
jgi:hypothetical protein